MAGFVGGLVLGLLIYAANDWLFPLDPRRNPFTFRFPIKGAPVLGVLALIPATISGSPRSGTRLLNRSSRVLLAAAILPALSIDYGGGVEACRARTSRPSTRALSRQRPRAMSGAMEALLVRAQEVAYRFSLLVCGHPEDAEDVMQDALMKTYRARRHDQRARGLSDVAVQHRQKCLPDETAPARRRTLQLPVGRTRHRDQGGNG